MHGVVIYEAWREWFFLYLAACVASLCQVALGILSPNAVLALMEGDFLRAAGVRPPLSILSNEAAARLRRILWLAVGSVWVVVSFAAFGWSVVRPWYAVRSGEVSVVSGAVTGMNTEVGTLSVGGIRFVDSGHAIRTAYAEKALRGEPVQNGLHVRITYLGDRRSPTVARVELLR